MKDSEYFVILDFVICKKVNNVINYKLDSPKPSKAGLQVLKLSIYNVLEIVTCNAFVKHNSLNPIFASKLNKFELQPNLITPNFFHFRIGFV